MPDSEPTNTTAEREFFDAVHRGDVSKVRDCIGRQPGLLESYDYQSFGATPLTCVTFKDDREMIAALLNLGADPDRRSDWQAGPWSPLHSAIHSNHLELAQYLLDSGATIDLHTAGAFGNIEQMTRLLDEDPELISARGGDGCMPLHFVGTRQAAELLLDRGADIDSRCIDHHSTPLHYAATTRPEIARFLIAAGAKADLFSAVLANDVGTVSEMIRRDASVLRQRINQETFPPLKEHDTHNILTFTVGHGCTALHAAASGDQAEMAHLLVHAGIDVNVRGGYDDATALHIAAWNDHSNVATALIELGANINLLSGDIHNNSPAGWAIVAGSADVFSVLMDHGCDVLDFFADDAQAAIDGDFRSYKCVPHENYTRIADRLLER